MTGLYYEEFEIGTVFAHALRHTITQADNVAFATMTHNPSPLHLDAEYMKSSEYGRPIVNSCLTLSLMVGISVGDTTAGTAVANLGWDEVRFPAPVFPDDTLHFETEVTAMRESKSRPNAGIVTFTHRGFNQRDELIASCKRFALMMKRPGGSDA
jgi:acyl dehydratase